MNLRSFHIGVYLGQRVYHTALGQGVQEIVSELERLTHSPGLTDGTLVTTTATAAGGDAIRC